MDNRDFSYGIKLEEIKLNLGQHRTKHGVQSLCGVALKRYEIISFQNTDLQE